MSLLSGDHCNSRGGGRDAETLLMAAIGVHHPELFAGGCLLQRTRSGGRRGTTRVQQVGTAPCRRAGGIRRRPAGRSPGPGREVVVYRIAEPSGDQRSQPAASLRSESS